MAAFTHRFTQAVDYARVAHASQTRKGPKPIPYLYHLLGVASLVIEHGGTEDQAIAALLHDVLEDCGAGHEATIRAQFGDAVANMVKACTDGTAEDKAEHTTVEAKRADWLRRKLAYLDHVAGEPDDALLVSACDKLHNARAIVQDILTPDTGLDVFNRFTASKEQTLAYYERLARIFGDRHSPVAALFDSVVAQIHVLAGNAARVPLT